MRGDAVQTQPCLDTAKAPKSKDSTAAAVTDVVAEQPAVGGGGDHVPLTQCRVNWLASATPEQRMTAVSPWRSTTVPVGVAKSAQPTAGTTECSHSLTLFYSCQLAELHGTLQKLTTPFYEGHHHHHHQSRPACSAPTTL